MIEKGSYQKIENKMSNGFLALSKYMVYTYVRVHVCVCMCVNTFNRHSPPQMAVFVNTLPPLLLRTHNDGIGKRR